jgi:hypothetical protein
MTLCPAAKVQITILVVGDGKDRGAVQHVLTGQAAFVIVVGVAAEIDHRLTIPSS